MSVSDPRVLDQVVVVADQDAAPDAAQVEDLELARPAQVRADERVQLAELGDEALRARRPRSSCRAGRRRRLDQPGQERDAQTRGPARSAAAVLGPSGTGSASAVDLLAGERLEERVAA